MLFFTELKLKDFESLKDLFSQAAVVGSYNMNAIQQRQRLILTLDCYHSRRLSTPTLNLMSLQRTLKLLFNWEKKIYHFECQRMNFVFLYVVLFSKKIQAQSVTAPTLLTAQASTSASSEQSFQKHHWNMTGCWVSCDCEASAPMPGKRPGCSFHCQETPWVMNKHMPVRELWEFTHSKICLEKIVTKSYFTG